MNPLSRILEEEIRREGSIPFRRFMEAALYDPEHGYYRRERDPFGTSGDFYTAEQLQPVFGILIARRIRALFEQMGRPADFTVVELGAGRAEMTPALAGFRYVPVEIARGELPASVRGVVFSNEFFDALPVERVVWRGGEARQLRVGWNGTTFAWLEGGPSPEDVQKYVRRYLPPLEEGTTAEVNMGALDWMERIARSLKQGYHLAIDYGYTRREAARFPEGTLMSYRRHVATEDVLAAPGQQDITAHVNFTALSEHGAQCGLETVTLETLARTLLAAGEDDRFAEALAATGPDEELRRRLQLKTLLYGMGETFRTLVQRTVGTTGGGPEK